VNRASNVTLKVRLAKRSRHRILASRRHWLILRRISRRPDAIAGNYVALCGR
jgi:hypothetical protein